MQDKLFLQSIKDSFSKHFVGKSKLNIALDIITWILFAAVFCSIPTCSFTSNLTIITWILTIGLLICLFLNCLFFYGFSFDIISVGLILFCLLILISTILNGWKRFVLTPIVLSIVTIAIYTYVKQNKNTSLFMLWAAFIGNFIFLITYIFVYRNELFSLNFDRLGSYFGDENDIALFMSLGSITSLYFALFKGGKFLKILFGLLCVIFLFCGASTGSKIFILLFVVALFALSFMFFGKKKWWLALIVSIGITVLGLVLIFTIPALSSIKSRLISFVNELFNLRLPGGSSTDLSTQGRFFMFVDGLDMFCRKPMLGWGINGFAVFGGWNNGWSHNNISESLCNFGLLGTVLFHLGFVYAIIGYRKTMVKEKNLYLLITIFFITAMISVALNSEKIYAFLIPVAFANLCVNTPIVKIKHIELKRLKQQV